MAERDEFNEVSATHESYRLPARSAGIPRGFARFFSILWLVALIGIGGPGVWAMFEKTTWPEADATVVAKRTAANKRLLVVEFVKPSGIKTSDEVRELTDRAVNDKVRIRYPGPGDAGQPELTEQPAVNPWIVAGSGIMLLVGIGMLYWAWWRMPPTEPTTGRDELTFTSDY